MNKEPNISLYCNQMDLIKKRIEVIQFLKLNQGNCLYPAATIETVYLQFRKILELIALELIVMGSLIVNKEIYSIERKKISKDWNAHLMFKRLELLNPEFYPSPIIESDGQILDKESDFLTKDDFLNLYNKKYSRIMHAENPYNKTTNYDEYLRQIPKQKR